MNKKQLRRLFLVGTVLWTIVIIALSVMPSNAIPRVKVPNMDKIVHFTMFSVYGFLVGGMLLTDKVYLIKIILIFLCLFLFGTVMEVWQAVIPDRTPDSVDLLFNGAGSFVGLTIFLVLRKKLIAQ